MEGAKKRRSARVKISQTGGAFCAGRNETSGARVEKKEGWGWRQTNERRMVRKKEEKGLRLFLKKKKLLAGIFHTHHVTWFLTRRSGILAVSSIRTHDTMEDSAGLNLNPSVRYEQRPLL